MGVFFFYRCPYQAPAGGHLKRFDDDTVLDWFRNHWHTLAGTDNDEVYERVARELGCEVYSFHCVFVDAAQDSRPPPATVDELRDCVSASYVNEVLCDSPHLLQVETDDDEIGMCYYFFDDHYLARHRKRAAFLLRGDWQLPGGSGPGGFRTQEKTARVKQRGPGQGSTYLVDLSEGSSMDDALTVANRIDGVRLPDLARHLTRFAPAEDDPYPLLLARALLTVAPAGVEPIESAFLRDIRTQPGDEAAWNAYSDWLQERGELPADLHLLRRALTWAGRWFDTEHDEPDVVGDPLLADLASAACWAEPQVAALERRQEPSLSLVHVDEHVAQLGLHYAHWARVDRHIYHEWIFFDDLWAGAQPDLARAILRYVRRWDVLSTSRTPAGD
jgi:uncharacterized protein (TIGR02996 family)